MHIHDQLNENQIQSDFTSHTKTKTVANKIEFFSEVRNKVDSRPKNNDSLTGTKNEMEMNIDFLDNYLLKDQKPLE